MKRGNFIKSMGLVLAQPAFSFSGDEEKRKMMVPPFLKRGASIGICSPAGHISISEIEAAVKMLQSWGFEVRIGTSVGKQWNTFGGTDEERLADLQQMVNDPSLAAIMCARGGYGMVRIIDKLDFSLLRKFPKWVLGFSDITVLHSHLNRAVRVASMHCKMCNSFPDDPLQADAEQMQAIYSIRENLSGSKNYSFPSPIPNRMGVAEGELVGGNLRTLENLAGTASDLKTEGKILFVEDTGEYLYSIDRMFWNLLRTGKLNTLAGLVIGGMKIRPDDPGEEFGISLADIIMEKVKEFNYPVAFGLPVGHQKNNVAVKCGVRYRLSVHAEETNLEEL